MGPSKAGVIQNTISDHPTDSLQVRGRKELTHHTPGHLFQSVYVIVLPVQYMQKVMTLTWDT